MALNQIYKTKASSLAKIAALPVYRSPADLLNEHTHPYQLQKKQLEAELSYKEGKYASNEHYILAKLIASTRKQFRAATLPAERHKIACKEYRAWNSYLHFTSQQSDIKLTEIQKEHIYEAMLTAKERKQERLALCRFIKFGYEYSQAFKVDLPLNPVVIMKMVHPHFGYLNRIPNLPEFKFTYQQIFTLIQQFGAASKIRQTELVSFIFWKILSKQSPILTTSNFGNMLKVFKFQGVTPDNLGQTFKYSLKQGELIAGQSRVRFDLFRQIFLDRNL